MAIEGEKRCGKTRVIVCGARTIHGQSHLVIPVVNFNFDESTPSTFLIVQFARKVLMLIKSHLSAKSDPKKICKPSERRLRHGPEEATGTRRRTRACPGTKTKRNFAGVELRQFALLRLGSGRPKSTWVECEGVWIVIRVVEDSPHIRYNCCTFFNPVPFVFIIRYRHVGKGCFTRSQLNLSHLKIKRITKRCNGSEP